MPPVKHLEGRLVLYQGEPHRVERVTPCSAALRPVHKQSRTIQPLTGPHAGRTLRFQAQRDLIHICPDSLLPLA